jgi:hypothetical protein
MAADLIARKSCVYHSTWKTGQAWENIIVVVKQLVVQAHQILVGWMDLGPLNTLFVVANYCLCSPLTLMKGQHQWLIFAGVSPKWIRYEPFFTDVFGDA